MIISNSADRASAVADLDDDDTDDADSRDVEGKLMDEEERGGTADGNGEVEGKSWSGECGFGDDGLEGSEEGEEG